MTTMRTRHHRQIDRWVLAVAILAGMLPGAARAQDAAMAPGQAEFKEPAPSGPRMEIYGFVMADAIYDFKQVNPDWYDVLRPTKLPAFPDEFGENGNTWFSVRQSRFGVKGWIPAGNYEVKTIFEFDLFGVGADAGQTTIRIRHLYGEIGQFGAGQYWSPFMDIDVFPNTVEYWGPNGMVFYRNIQVRWMPIRGDSFLTIALERPGASADAGEYSDRVELEGIKPHFPYPDLSAEYRYAGKWGYVEAAGILRRIQWEDTKDDDFDLDGGVTGWGINLSSNIKAGANDVIRLQYAYGEGIENYMNDAPVDVGIESADNAFGGKGVALPVTGIVAYLDHRWSGKWTSAIGYSMLSIDNSDLQLPSDFHYGQYASANLIYYPAPNMLAGAELIWGSRENYSDGFSTDDYRLQFSFKYNFSTMLGGKK
jgi:hypothetical protein